MRALLAYAAQDRDLYLRPQYIRHMGKTDHLSVDSSGVDERTRL